MSQYFKAINPERKEFITLGGKPSPRRLLYDDNPNKLAYLLLDGPADGTNFADVPLSELPESAVEEKKETVKDRVDSRDTDLTESAYYNEELGWNEDELARVIVARLPIADLYAYAGRWANDDGVRLIGDYEESGVYQDSYKDATVELDDGRVVELENRGTMEAVTGQKQLDGTLKISYQDKDAEPEDTVLLKRRNSPTGERELATLVEYTESDWTDITKPVNKEMRARFRKNEFALPDPPQNPA